MGKTLTRTHRVHVRVRRETEAGVYLFTNDYSQGAHPDVLAALVKTNLEQTPGYTVDPHCDRARDLVREACSLCRDDASVEFITGGTAANICTLLGLLDRPYDAVVCAPSGHINTHETGALEACGHKICTMRGPEADAGFVCADAVDEIVSSHAAFANHMVRPRVIYISNSTEYGGAYTLDRVTELSEYAHAHDMKLFVDGARMASALTSPGTDLTLEALAHLADAFTLGGTKCGLLFGEAVVARDPQLAHDLPWIQKRQGNLLAKGRLLGVQFETALESGSIWEWARSANERAARLGAGLKALGWREFLPSPTNQQFFVVDQPTAQWCVDVLGCEVFGDVEDGRVVRFVTSWATTDTDVDEALLAVREASVKGFSS